MKKKPKPSKSHSPTLATIRMVECTLKDAQHVLKLSELKRELPRKVMHSTLVQIIDYLQEEGKILIGTKGILWIYTPRAELEKLKKSGREWKPSDAVLTKH